MSIAVMRSWECDQLSAGPCIALLLGRLGQRIFLKLIRQTLGIPRCRGDRSPEKPNRLTPKIIMKHLILLAALSALVSGSVCAENPAPGYIDFGKFSPPSTGGEFVEVHVKSNLISMVARLAEKGDPEVAEFLRGLKLVRVNVIGLNGENRDEIQKRVKTIRGDLDAQGWERVVTAQKKDEDVSVYIKTRGEEAVEGLVVTVLEANHEAVLINIVGNIKPEKIALLGERFNIEPLKKVGHSLEKK